MRMKIANLFFLLIAALAAVLSTQALEALIQEVDEAASTESGGEEAGETVDLDVDSETSGTGANDAEDADPVEVAPVQSGPFVDLFGPTLLSLEMIDETRAQLESHYTNDALRGKNVVGLYFSADWCGPCRQFTPELVQFYDKMNARRGKENKFEIIWVSRCRDMDSYGQYFTHMNWLALPPEEAMGQRGQMLSDKYKVKGIPSLVLLDEVGNVITLDARTKIPADKAGIGFPWRNPLATFYTTIIPKSLRLMVKVQVVGMKDKLISKIRLMVPLPGKAV